MKKIRMIALIMMAAGMIAFRASAGSLWNDNSESMYADKKALYVGDIVTIVVNENTSATQKSKSSIKQNEKMDSSTGTGFIGQFLQAFGIQAGDQYSADGNTSSGSTLATTISAEVMEVLPNGNLLIEARKSMVVNAETQTVVLSGVIRPNDVARNNQIGSSVIANLNLRYEGKGPIAKRQKPGILNKLFDLIF
ncbi:MAG: flagellar basal body L-ring protein FlgH [bacterium]